MQDLRLAFRQLAKSPGFAATAILTLALGIGTCTAMFSIVNRLVLQPLPYAEASRLVQLWEDYRGDGTGQNAVSGGVARAWQEQTTTLEDLAIQHQIQANLTGHAQPLRLDGLQVSTNYLRLLQLSPSRGRDFRPEEARSGRSDVTILTHAAWQKNFGGDPALVGATIQLGNKPTTVIGILPPSARLTVDADFLVPFDYGTPGWNRFFAGHDLLAIGRLKPTASLAQLRQEMAAITDRIRNNFPAFKQKWGVSVLPLHEQITGKIRAPLLLLFGATGGVLLIACANLAGLLLARAVSREKEMAVRLTLGASRVSIVRQLLTENLLLALLGSGLGVLLASWSIGAFEQWRPGDLAPGLPVSLDGRAVGFALVLSLLSGLTAGFVPAWRLGRAHFDTLKSGTRNSAAGTHTGVRGALVVGQIALSVILLAGAGLMLRSLARLQSVPLGFEPAGTLVADFTLDSDSFRDAGKRVRYLEEIARRVAALRGVEHAAFSANLPLVNGLTEFVARSGTTTPPILAAVNFLHGDYLATMRIPLLGGRPLAAADNQPNAPRTVLLGTDLAAKLFPGESPLGRRISLLGQQWEVVGITGNVLLRGADQSTAPLVFVPEVFASGFNRHLIVRTQLPPLSLARSIETAVHAVGPDQPVSNLRTYDRILAQAAFVRRLMLGLLGVFALAALALTAVGLYGIIAFSVERRTRELGIRSALGATRRHLVALVISSTLKLTLAGIAFGLAGGFCLTGIAAKFLFETSATDPVTLAGVMLLLVASATLACWLPARRATKVDPMVALRAE